MAACVGLTNFLHSQPNPRTMSTAYNYSLVFALVLCAGTICSVNAQTTLVLVPNMDTEIGYHDNYNSANTNYNSSIHYSAISQPGASGGVNKARGLMSFDLTPIPNDATVMGAFLSLSASGPVDPNGDVTAVGSMGQNNSKLLRITSPWNDNSVTWNSQPSSTAVNAVSLEQSTYSMQNYLNIEVTALVQDMVADPANSYGFMLKLDNETPTRGLCFHSGLAPEPDKLPQLIVIYGECGRIGIDEINGEDGKLRLTPNITYPGSTVQLDMGANLSGTSDLVLIDALGQIILSRSVNSWPLTMTVPAVASGTYSWKVENPVGKVFGLARMVVR